MTLSVNSIPVRVRAHLAGRGEDVANLRDNRILALIPDALRVLADKGYVRKTYTIAAVNGVVDLTAALADLIMERVREAQVTFADFDFPLQWKADRASLQYPSSSAFGYVAPENKTLLVDDGTGTIAYSGAGQLRNAPFRPALTDVNATLEPIFIAIIAEMANMPARTGTNG
jgi:hypothetical protein